MADERGSAPILDPIPAVSAYVFSSDGTKYRVGGPRGPQGPLGATGPAGPGIPIGGQEGQVMTKASLAAYDVLWADAAPSHGTVSPVNVPLVAGWEVSDAAHPLYVMSNGFQVLYTGAVRKTAQPFTGTYQITVPGSIPAEFCPPINVATLIPTATLESEQSVHFKIVVLTDGTTVVNPIDAAPVGGVIPFGSRTSLLFAMTWPLTY